VTPADEEGQRRLDNLDDLIRRVLAGVRDRAEAGHKTAQDGERRTGEEAGHQAREGQARQAPKSGPVRPREGGWGLGLGTLLP